MNIRLGTVFGVEVGPQAVKVAELRFSIRKFELVNFQETPYRTAENGELLVSETLQTLFQKKRSRKRVIASLPGDSVAFRFITFPFLEKKKIDSVIRFEVENLLPFDPEQIIADYVLLGNDGKNTSVLCAVTEKSNVEKFLHTLSRGGLDPEAVDVDLFGFFNTVRASLSGSPGTVLVLNVDSVNTSLLVVENGKLQCVRTLTIGFTHLNQEKEAPRQNKIFAEEQGVSPPSFNDEKVREFLVELKRVFSFVEENGESVIGRIYCSGTPPEGLLSTLSTEFNVEATPWDPLKTPAFRNGRVGMNGNQNTAAVALGLSLRALKGSFSGVDFRKTVFPVKKFFHGVSGNLKTSLSLAGCTLLLFTLSLFFQERVYQKRLQQLRIEGRGIFKKAVPEVKRVVNEIAQLKEKIAKIRLENIILGTVEGHKESPILFLREITLNYPKEDSGEIYRYTFGKEDIRIEGTSPSLRTVDEIKKSLAKIKGVKKIQVTNTKLAADKESVDFKLILLLSGVKK